MITWPRCAVLLRWGSLLLVLGMLLAACSPAGAPSEVEVVKTVEPTRAVEPAAAETAVSAQATATFTPAPAVEVTRPPAPTQALPTSEIPTPVVLPPVVEGRVLELEWPERMRLGDSDVVRLSLAPSADGYTVTTEFSEHRTITQTVQLQRPSGYDLYAAARLDSVGFDLAPAGEQERFLTAGETITWRWSLRPHQPGQQRLSVVLLLRWKPTAGSTAAQREQMVYSRALDIQVSSFFGLTRGQAATGGLVGLLFGSGLALSGLLLLGWLRLPGQTQPLLQVVAPNPALLIEPRPGLALTGEESTLLRSLFSRYARLVLEREFLSGYSGARTFLAQPIRADGRADAYTIVKVSERSSIQQEFQNFETFVKDTLPPVTARIQHPPVIVRSAGQADRAALQYTFIGAPGTSPLSLHQALLQDPDPALLHKLFDTFGPNWWMQRSPYTFRAALEYDRVLPTHYVIEPAAAQSRSAVLDGRMSPGEAELSVGDLVTLRGFAQIERRPDGRSLSLQGTARPGQPPLRARWLGLSDPHSSVGRVVDTRYTLLQGFVKGLNLYGLPDPCADQRLQAWLSVSLSGTRSTIHGDLNLENVLVGPGGFVWLIDFAMTRDGHTLYDFAHLGAEMVAHLAASQMADARAYLDFLQAVFEKKQHPSPLLPVFLALREIASTCLFNPAQPREYALALGFACLGALKFTNLDAHQKHLLYLTAAYLGRFSKGETSQGESSLGGTP